MISGFQSCFLLAGTTLVRSLTRVGMSIPYPRSNQRVTSETIALSLCGHSVQVEPLVAVSLIWSQWPQIYDWSLLGARIPPTHHKNQKCRWLSTNQFQHPFPLRRTRSKTSGLSPTPDESFRRIPVPLRLDRCSHWAGSKMHSLEMGDCLALR
jgi:hypothetical protein